MLIRPLWPLAAAVAAGCWSTFVRVVGGAPAAAASDAVRYVLDAKSVHSGNDFVWVFPERPAPVYLTVQGGLEGLGGENESPAFADAIITGGTVWQGEVSRGPGEHVEFRNWGAVQHGGVAQDDGDEDAAKNAAYAVNNFVLPMLAHSNRAVADGAGRWTFFSPEGGRLAFVRDPPALSAAGGESLRGLWFQPAAAGAPLRHGGDVMRYVPGSYRGSRPRMFETFERTPLLQLGYYEYSPDTAILVSSGANQAVLELSLGPGNRVANVKVLSYIAQNGDEELFALEKDLLDLLMGMQQVSCSLDGRGYRSCSFATLEDAIQFSAAPGVAREWSLDPLEYWSMPAIRGGGAAAAALEPVLPAAGSAVYRPEEFRRSTIPQSDLTVGEVSPVRVYAKKYGPSFLDMTVVGGAETRYAISFDPVSGQAVGTHLLSQRMLNQSLRDDGERFILTLLINPGRVVFAPDDSSFTLASATDLLAVRLRAAGAAGAPGRRLQQDLLRELTLELSSALRAGRPPLLAPGPAGGGRGAASLGDDLIPRLAHSLTELLNTFNSGGAGTRGGVAAPPLAPASDLGRVAEAAKRLLERLTPIGGMGVGAAGGGGGPGPEDVDAILGAALDLESLLDELGELSLPDLLNLMLSATATGASIDGLYTLLPSGYARGGRPADLFVDARPFPVMLTFAESRPGAARIVLKGANSLEFSLEFDPATGVVREIMHTRATLLDAEPHIVAVEQSLIAIMSRVTRIEVAEEEGGVSGLRLATSEGETLSFSPSIMSMNLLPDSVTLNGQMLPPLDEDLLETVPSRMRLRAVSRGRIEAAVRAAKGPAQRFYYTYDPVTGWVASTAGGGGGAAADPAAVLPHTEALAALFAGPERILFDADGAIHLERRGGADSVSFLPMNFGVVRGRRRRLQAVCPPGSLFALAADRTRVSGAPSAAIGALTQKYPPVSLCNAQTGAETQRWTVAAVSLLEYDAAVGADGAVKAVTLVNAEVGGDRETTEDVVLGETLLRGILSSANAVSRENGELRIASSDGSSEAVFHLLPGGDQRRRLQQIDGGFFADGGFYGGGMPETGRAFFPSGELWPVHAAPIAGDYGFVPSQASAVPSLDGIPPSLNPAFAHRSIHEDPSSFGGGTFFPSAGFNEMGPRGGPEVVPGSVSSGMMGVGRGYGGYPGPEIYASNDYSSPERAFQNFGESVAVFPSVSGGGFYGGTLGTTADFRADATPAFDRFPGSHPQEILGDNFYAPKSVGAHFGEPTAGFPVVTGGYGSFAPSVAHPAGRHGSFSTAVVMPEIGGYLSVAASERVFESAGASVPNRQMHAAALSTFGPAFNPPVPYPGSSARYGQIDGYVPAGADASASAYSPQLPAYPAAPAAYPEPVASVPLAGDFHARPDSAFADALAAPGAWAPVSAPGAGAAVSPGVTLRLDDAALWDAGALPAEFRRQPLSAAFDFPERGRVVLRLWEAGSEAGPSFGIRLDPLTGQILGVEPMGGTAPGPTPVETWLSRYISAAHRLSFEPDGRAIFHCRELPGGLVFLPAGGAPGGGVPAPPSPGFKLVELLVDNVSVPLTAPVTLQLVPLSRGRTEATVRARNTMKFVIHYNVNSGVVSRVEEAMSTLALGGPEEDLVKAAIASAKIIIFRGGEEVRFISNYGRNIAKFARAPPADELPPAAESAATHLAVPGSFVLGGRPATLLLPPVERVELALTLSRPDAASVAFRGKLLTYEIFFDPGTGWIREIVEGPSSRIAPAETDAILKQFVERAQRLVLEADGRVLFFANGGMDRLVFARVPSVDFPAPPAVEEELRQLFLAPSTYMVEGVLAPLFPPGAPPYAITLSYLRRAPGKMELVLHARNTVKFDASYNNADGWVNEIAERSSTRMAPDLAEERVRQLIAGAQQLAFEADGTLQFIGGEGKNRVSFRTEAEAVPAVPVVPGFPKPLPPVAVPPPVVFPPVAVPPIAPLSGLPQVPPAARSIHDVVGARYAVIPESLVFRGIPTALFAEPYPMYLEALGKGVGSVRYSLQGRGVAEFAFLYNDVDGWVLKVEVGRVTRSRVPAAEERVRQIMGEAQQIAFEGDGSLQFVSNYGLERIAFRAVAPAAVPLVGSDAGGSKAAQSRGGAADGAADGGAASTSGEKDFSAGAAAGGTGAAAGAPTGHSAKPVSSPLPEAAAYFENEPGVSTTAEPLWRSTSAYPGVAVEAFSTSPPSHSEAAETAAAEAAAAENVAAQTAAGEAAAGEAAAEAAAKSAAAAAADAAAGGAEALTGAGARGAAILLQEREEEVLAPPFILAVGRPMIYRAVPETFQAAGVFVPLPLEPGALLLARFEKLAPGEVTVAVRAMSGAQPLELGKYRVKYNNADGWISAVDLLVPARAVVGGLRAVVTKLFLNAQQLAFEADGKIQVLGDLGRNRLTFEPAVGLFAQGKDVGDLFGAQDAGIGTSGRSDAADGVVADGVLTYGFAKRNPANGTANPANGTSGRSDVDGDVAADGVAESLQKRKRRNLRAEDDSDSAADAAIAAAAAAAANATAIVEPVVRRLHPSVADTPFVEDVLGLQEVLKQVIPLAYQIRARTADVFEQDKMDSIIDAAERVDFAMRKTPFTDIAAVDNFAIFADKYGKGTATGLYDYLVAVAGRVPGMPIVRRLEALPESFVVDNAPAQLYPAGAGFETGGGARIAISRPVDGHAHVSLSVVNTFILIYDFTRLADEDGGGGSGGGGFSEGSGGGGAGGGFCERCRLAALCPSTRGGSLAAPTDCYGVNSIRLVQGPPVRRVSAMVRGVEDTVRQHLMNAQQLVFHKHNGSLTLLTNFGNNQLTFAPPQSGYGLGDLLHLLRRLNLPFEKFALGDPVAASVYQHLAFAKARLEFIHNRLLPLATRILVASLTAIDFRETANLSGALGHDSAKVEEFGGRSGPVDPAAGFISAYLDTLTTVGSVTGNALAAVATDDGDFNVDYVVRRVDQLAVTLTQMGMRTFDDLIHWLSRFASREFAPSHAGTLGEQLERGLPPAVAHPANADAEGVSLVADARYCSYQNASCGLENAECAYFATFFDKFAPGDGRLGPQALGASGVEKKRVMLRQHCAGAMRARDLMVADFDCNVADGWVLGKAVRRVDGGAGTMEVFPLYEAVNATNQVHVQADGTVVLNGVIEKASVALVPKARLVASDLAAPQEFADTVLARIFPPVRSDQSISDTVSLLQRYLEMVLEIQREISAVERSALFHVSPSTIANLLYTLREGTHPGGSAVIDSLTIFQASWPATMHDLVAASMESFLSNSELALQRHQVRATVEAS